MYRLPVLLTLWLAGMSLNVQAQQVSPLVVETIRKSAEPTTVRTGEPFTLVYKIRWISSASWGKEVLLLEDQTKPKKFPAPLGDFEIVGWVMEEPVVTKNGESDEHSRRLSVAFRLVNPQKGPYRIPSIEIYWAIKSGEMIENQEPMETDEVPINYASVITDDPYLDVREGVNFGSYSRRAVLFWWLSRAVFPLLASLALIAMLQSLRSAKRRKAIVRKEMADRKEETLSGTAAVYAPVSFNKSYRKFLRTLSEYPRSEFISPAKKQLVADLYRVLKSHLNLKPGDTFRDIRAAIAASKKGDLHKRAMLDLSEHLASLEADVNTGNFQAEPDVKKIRKLVRLLKRRWRITYYLRMKKDVD